MLAAILSVPLAPRTLLAQPCPPDSVVMRPAIDVGLEPEAPFRWKDVAGNPYALAYRDTFSYAASSVAITFDPCGEAWLRGRVSASNLKPNFAYQLKLLGKPTALWGDGGDNLTNERLGYAGRWWRNRPNPGNSDDAEYQAHKSDTSYVFEGYLIFGFFVTDRFGNASVDFVTDDSFHVLWWDGQRTPGSCDSPTQWSTVVGHAEDPAYDHDVGPTQVGVYAEIERLCYGATALPPAQYDCRIMLTEESFHQSGPPDPGWVSVNGNRFWMDGGPFYYAGTNNYYLMVYSADSALRPYVDEVLEDARAMGLSVVRTWAFNDGSTQWHALQTAPGVYDESVFQGLDYVLEKARQLRLHLILTLVNNWDDYGGMSQYVQWSPTASTHDQFYTDASCRQWYRDHVATVLNRVNAFNGRVYKDDPTVFAWELANEPRCQSDPSGNVLQGWINDMSGYVKSLDARHLVTTGSEGFYGPSGPNHNPVGWFGSVGVDFVRNHQPAGIDFACFHAFPDYWGLSYAQSMTWAQDHIDDTQALLGRPVIFEEFGKYRPLATRDSYYQGWFDQVYSGAASGKAAGGSHFWILYHDAYPDYDGFGVYDPQDASTVSTITAEAVKMRALCAPLAAEGQWASVMVCDTLRFEVRGPTDVALHDGLGRFALGLSYPNPFRGQSNIAYRLPEPSEVNLGVYDVTGRMVRRLVSGLVPAGEHRAVWNGEDGSGQSARGGVYFYRLQIPGRFDQVRRAILLR